MIEQYTSLGLMSGTSGDGVDASIIQSNGETKYEVIKDKYYEYDIDIYQDIHKLKEKIHSINDLGTLAKELKDLERRITLFHAKVIEEIKSNNQVDIVGFHGQTIYHNAQEKISSQLGDGKLLSQLTKKNVIFNFRQNDIQNGGEGAPLTPIFHKLIVDKYNINLPICILNIGGISNITILEGPKKTYGITSRDIGPGNCLIDAWVRKNSKYKYDRDGILASSGKRNDIIFEQAQELYENRPNQNTLSFDTNDFDISFARGLSLEDGAATLTDFTARVIGSALYSLLSNVGDKLWKVIVCGGGRKNNFLIDKKKKNTFKNIIFQPIDDYGVNGDFIEVASFRFLAIRSLLKLPISFPETTGCTKPCTGGSW